MEIVRHFLLRTSSVLLVATLLMVSCKNDEQYQENVTEETEEYTFFYPDNPLNVSACDAENVACAFMRSDRGDNTQKSSDISYCVQDLTVIPDENMEPAMYVINLSPDGFCIVSATKQIDPILAYCDEGSFSLDNLSAGLADWLYEKMEKIQYIRNDTSCAISEPIAAIWHDYSNYNHTNKRRYASSPNFFRENYTIGPLLKTLWGQGYPYNYYLGKKCSNLDDKIYFGKYPTGCVATALAQVLKYYAYPENKYKWSKMKSSYNEYSLMDEGAKNMAKMFLDLGEWLNMKYGCTGSDAFTSEIPNVLTTYFNYADGGIYRKLSVEEAEPIVRTEINNKRPVIMDGYGTLTKKREKYKFWKYKEVPDDGHCWVCDGYKQITSTILVIYDFKTKDTKTVTRKVNKTFYHMNWGEDGYGMGNMIIMDGSL